MILLVLFCVCCDFGQHSDDCCDFGSGSIDVALYLFEILFILARTFMIFGQGSFGVGLDFYDSGQDSCELNDFGTDS